MMLRSLRLIFFFSILFCAQLTAQVSATQLELKTPYDAMWVHLYHLQPGTYEPAIAATAFVNGDSIARENWAIQLKQILDGAGLYVHMNMLPQDADYTDSIVNKHFYTPFPDELPEVFLTRIEERWYYADETTAAIPRLLKEVFPFGTNKLVDMFSQGSGSTFLGLSSWQYAGIGFLIVISFLFYLLVTRILRFIINRSTTLILSNIPDFTIHVSKIASVAGVWLMVWLIKLLVPLLQLPINALSFIQVALRIILTLLVMLLVLRLINLLTSYLTQASAKTESRMDDQIVPLLKQIFKIIVIGVTILQVLRLLDFNITALIAGVSIGGLALALAAQDTVKNFLGSVMIFADRPFQIGDWVEGSGFAGSVVEVGFRSTRIRTSDTSIISVPNGNMANVSVTNKGARTYRIYVNTLGITYDTPPALIEHFMAGIKKIILRHPEVSNEDYYVHFTEFAGSSLNILVRGYLIAPTYADELRIRESIHLAILRWAESIAVRFAFPTTTIHVEELPGQVSLTPTYKIDDQIIDEKWEIFMIDFEKRFSDQ